jgi:CRISPR system Cascade subunit CasB
MSNSPVYFRVLKFSGANDNKQTLRILFLFVAIDVSNEDDAVSVAEALINAGVKEQQIIQIVRSGENGIEYLKRQLVRCKNIKIQSLGELAQYWSEQARRNLLKEYILFSPN